MLISSKKTDDDEQKLQQIINLGVISIGKDWLFLQVSANH